MTSHNLAISKASLAAGFMRPDPVSVPRDQISHFHDLLSRALTKCSPANIQRCKAWLLEYTIPSAARITALGKYLASLSASFKTKQVLESSETNGKQSAGARRCQLHVLYLLNDVLHHTKFHSKNSSNHSTLTNALQPYLVDCVKAAAAYDPQIYSKQHNRIAGLIREWDRYFPSSYIQILRGNSVFLGNLSLKDEKDLVGSGGNENGPENLDRNKHGAPFIMPATHGDISAAYYELPAANMMPHIKPNSATPINPQLLRPLQFSARTADSHLVSAVQSFMRDVDALYGQGLEQEDGTTVDVDELGQSLIRSEITGQLADGEAYYGWSKAFCEKMRGRREGKVDLSRTRGRSQSVSRSSSPRKRRRYTSSNSSRRDRSMSSGTSRKYPRRSSTGRSRQRSFSPPRSLSRSRPRSSNYAHDRSRSRSQTRNDAMAAQFPRFQHANQQLRQPQTQHPQLQMPGQGLSQPPLPIPLSDVFPQGIPLGPDGLPIPPPPPPNYKGLWPPPPPPPGPNGSPFAQFPAFLPPPPPPPPAMDAHGYPVQGGPASGAWGMSPRPHDGAEGHISHSQQPSGRGWKTRGGRGHRGAWRG